MCNDEVWVKLMKAVDGESRLPDGSCVGSATCSQGTPPPVSNTDPFDTNHDPRSLSGK